MPTQQSKTVKKSTIRRALLKKKDRKQERRKENQSLNLANEARIALLGSDLEVLEAEYEESDWHSKATIDELRDSLATWKKTAVANNEGAECLREQLLDLTNAKLGAITRFAVGGSKENLESRKLLEFKGDYGSILWAQLAPLGTTVKHAWKLLEGTDREGRALYKGSKESKEYKEGKKGPGTDDGDDNEKLSSDVELGEEAENIDTEDDDEGHGTEKEENDEDLDTYLDEEE